MQNIMIALALLAWHTKLRVYFSEAAATTAPVSPPSSLSSEPCKGFCVGTWPYGCNANLVNKVNYMRGSAGGCYYSTTLEDKGPSNFCVFKGPGVIKTATSAPMAPAPTTKAPVPVTLAPVPKPSTAVPVVSSAPIIAKTKAPVAVSPAPSPPTTATTAASSSKCGGAVNIDCATYLWNRTNDSTMHCYGYGGPSDPCALHNNNDFDEGITKDPSACLGDTFYLWDEPDTQGFSYEWAGSKWLEYASYFSSEIMVMRARGTKFTSPLIKAGGSGVIASNAAKFFNACGMPCRDSKNPAYIDVVSVNAFAGNWNRAGLEGCLDAATFVRNEVQKLTYGIPVFITNWSRLFTTSVQDQADCMKATGAYFSPGSPVKRVYWFGATDYGGVSSNNKLTNVLPDGKTLGQLWQATCDAL